MRPASTSPKWTSLTVPMRQRSAPDGRRQRAERDAVALVLGVRLEAVEVVDVGAVVERGRVVGDGGQLDGHG